MSNLTQFIGGSRPPKLLFNAFSAGSVSSPLGTNAAAKETASGALSAGVLKTIATVTGAGAVKLLYAKSADGATSQTIRLKVTIDGVAVFDATTGSVTTTNNGLVAVGQIQYTGSTDVVFDEITFNSSLLVEVASSATATDKITTGIIYETR